MRLVARTSQKLVPQLQIKFSLSRPARCLKYEKNINMSKDDIPPSSEDAALVEGVSSLEVDEIIAATDATEQIPPHRSHDPQHNLKRTDPFQFGSRFLSEEDNVFEFNAWDHVETDETYKEYAELQYAKQREAPVSDFDKSTYKSVSLPPNNHCPLRHHRYLMISNFFV
jgi:hypothetical protein